MTTRQDPTYRSWRGALARCYNPRATGFERYGGRGIKVCDRWRSDYQAFLADMGPRPPGHTLDRIDNDKPYEPGNCRWATPSEQNNNQRTNHRLTIGTVTRTVAQWARLVGLRAVTLRTRLRDGWTAEAAVTTPARSAEILTVEGESKTLEAWAAHTGIAIFTLRSRLQKGWPPTAVISRPVRRTLLTLRGRTMNVAAWARERRISEAVLRARLDLGWDARRALTTPVVPREPPVTFDGQTKTIPEWARELGINRTTLSSRLKKGWPIEKALRTPARYKSEKSSSCLDL